MISEINYKLSCPLFEHIAEFDDGVVLYNTNNSNTVLFNKAVLTLQDTMQQKTFSLSDCLDNGPEQGRQLVVDSLNSLEEFGYIHRVSL